MPNVWTISRPFTRLGIIHFGGRSTVIQLKDGGVWVLASTPLEQETKAVIDKLGPVKFIMGANAVHHLFLGQYKKAYPSAKLIAPADALPRLEDKSLKFDGAWGRDSPDTTYGFEDEIKACYFSGYKNKDVAFFHLETMTLIQADLIFNLPCNEQYSKAKSKKGLSFLMINPWSWLHSRSAWSSGVDKVVMKRDIKTVASWDFKRIIPCHGDVIEGNGKDAWMNAFKLYLQDG